MCNASQSVGRVCHYGIYYSGRIENTLGLRFVMGIVISLVVGAVIIGGIRRISVISAKIVPVMVTCYMLLVFVILCLNFDKLPGVLASIFQSAFSLEAGIGGILGTALTGARPCCLRQ